MELDEMTTTLAGISYVCHGGDLDVPQWWMLTAERFLGSNTTASSPSSLLAGQNGQCLSFFFYIFLLPLGLVPRGFISCRHLPSPAPPPVLA